jgi:DNA-3-methyladenine glycosylase II
MSGRRAGQSHGAEQQLMLPAGYRMTEFWGFHRRDALRLSECDLQDGAITRMHKGLMWKGRPTLLTLELTQQCEGASVVQARWRLPADAGAITGMDDVLAAMLRRMFGLSQDVGEFERRFGRHARLGPQQLWCMPEAAQLAQLGEEDLRAAGFSRSKTQTLRLLAQAVQSGELPLDDWAAMPHLPVAEIRERLLALKGIGPWTVNYMLLRGYGHLDGPLHGDVAVRRALALLLKTDAMDAVQTELWLRDFAPWRALVAAHLWASLSSTAF